MIRLEMLGLKHCYETKADDNRLWYQTTDRQVLDPVVRTIIPQCKASEYRKYPRKPLEKF